MDTNVQPFRNWKKKRTELDVLVVRIADRLKQIRAGIGPAQLAAFVASCGGPSEISNTQAMAHLMWSDLDSELKIDSGITLIEGLLPGLIEHTWYEVRGKVEEVCDPRWVYIIDPCPPDVRPQVPIIFNPNSPYQHLFMHAQPKQDGAG